MDIGFKIVASLGNGREPRKFHGDHNVQFYNLCVDSILCSLCENSSTYAFMICALSKCVLLIKILLEEIRKKNYLYRNIHHHHTHKKIFFSFQLFIQSQKWVTELLWNSIKKINYYGIFITPQQYYKFSAILSASFSLPLSRMKEPGSDYCAWLQGARQSSLGWRLS